ncbi:hypothetical protein Pedsa_0068 [Pseudopedobacter saltans DSM 12145]|uniref:Alpha/beta hydrolase n=1 Tax=Pseudopedobacter saltans (strain ATCC 51119 / DSM 12145 / JCM 21818 / CCUG 39354 / LMG 10337 / NBRC 100064 / NCIMB 13643) TaxID=762903 RepID=F0SC71_PSESL|nr:hypothetical protein Pedsa_0068 [Pseudopedobacter saltans DSM 12145]
MKNLYLSLFLLLTFAFRSSAQPQIGFQNYFPEGI